MTNTNCTNVILGDEFDDALRSKLLNTLRELGAFNASLGMRSVVGSQDFETFEVVVDGQVLRVEAETYIGLSIEGPADLVARVQRMMTN
jgi:hypothetical protein